MKSRKLYILIGGFVAVLVLAGISVFFYNTCYNSKEVKTKSAAMMMCGGYNSNQPSAAAKNINWVRAKADENIQVVSDTKKCALHLNKCKASLSKKKFITLEATPKPITHNQVTTFRVVTSDDKIIPIEIDFVGINLNMGYLRPQLKKIGKNTYNAQIQIPFCEEKQMQWKVQVIFQNSNNKTQKQAAVFYMTSIN